MVPDVHYLVRPKLCTSETVISEKAAPARNRFYEFVKVLLQNITT